MFVKQKSGLIHNTDQTVYRALLAQRETQKANTELQHKVSEVEAALIDIRAELARLKKER